MLRIGGDISIAESLAGILLEIIRSGDNLKAHDAENLLIILKEKISDLKNRFETVEVILKI